MYIIQVERKHCWDRGHYSPLEIPYFKKFVHLQTHKLATHHLRTLHMMGQAQKHIIIDWCPQNILWARFQIHWSFVHFGIILEFTKVNRPFAIPKLITMTSATTMSFLILPTNLYFLTFLPFTVSNQLFHYYLPMPQIRMKVQNVHLKCQKSRLHFNYVWPNCPLFLAVHMEHPHNNHFD